jgi:group I intron endonuclease
MKLDGKIKSKPGVYMIKNTVNGKVYIGSSLNILRRAKHHKRYLDSKSHANRYLQRSYDKHGSDCFIITALEYCKDSELLRLESSYLSKFQSSDRKYGYNIAEIDTDGRITHSSETRKIISTNSKLYQNTLTPEERSLRARKAWENISSEDRTAIAKKANSAISPEERSKQAKERWSKLTIEERKNIASKMSKAKSKPVICSDGTIFPSQSLAARHFNVRQSLIHRAVTSGKRYEKLNYLSLAYHKEDSDAFSN